LRITRFIRRPLVAHQGEQGTLLAPCLCWKSNSCKICRHEEAY